MALSRLFSAGLHTQTDMWHCLGPLASALVGPSPTERSQACSERSDEGRENKLHITQTEYCTEHRLKTAHYID